MGSNIFLARLAIPFVFAVVVMGLSYMQAKHEVRDRIYPFPIASVSETIDETGLPMMVFGERAASARHWRIDNNTSAWALENSEGDEFLRFTAKAAGDGRETRIRYEVEAPEGENHDKLAAFLKQNSAMVDSYKAAVAEQVDAALTRRPFSMANIMGSMARGSLSQLGMMKTTMKSAGEAYQKEHDDNVEGAYERAAAR